MLYSRIVNEQRNLHSLHFPGHAWRLLAGLQAAIAAAAIMAAYLFVENLLIERSPWQTPHLYAALLLGFPALRSSSFGFHTLVGYALLFAISGAQGLLFGLVIPPRVGPVWSANAGIFLALAWYLAGFRAVVAEWRPGLLHDMAHPALLLGYFIFGVVLGIYPRLHRRIARPLAASDE